MTTTNIDANLDVVNKIKKYLIEPTYYSDIEDSIRWRGYWKKIGNAIEATGRIFAGISTILAFSAGFFNLVVLSFVSGCLGTISLVFLHFSSYAMRESRERTSQANLILDNLGIKRLVDIVVDSDGINDDATNLKKLAQLQPKSSSANMAMNPVLRSFSTNKFVDPSVDTKKKSKTDQKNDNTSGVTDV